MMNLNRLLNPFRLWMTLLASVVAAGVVAGGLVLWKGLSLTNLTDLVPWGLWITIDLSSIALSAGAFSICAAVYLLGLKEFQPVARTATFIGIIGYSMAMLCLLLDIGRPDRFWHAFVFWNTHSVLWEVTMCVGLYFSVLLLETLPIIGRATWVRYLFPRVSNLLGKVHHLAPVLALAGLGFSMLHQSSLGATYAVLKSRPIWYRPGLAVLFIFSAVIGGMALTILASMLSARFSRRVVIDQNLLDRLARFVGWALVAYLYMRIWDVFAMTYTNLPGRTEGLKMLTGGSLAFNFWFGELLFGALIPAILLLNKRFAQRRGLQIAALAMIVGGVVAYRWDINLVGQLVVMNFRPWDTVALYTRYFPSLIEIISGAGVVAYGFMAFTLGVRYLNVVDHRPEVAVHHVTKPVLAPAPAD